MKLSEYLESKKISIEVRDWELDKNDNTKKVVAHKIEGDTPNEFFKDYEDKFKKKLEESIKQKFLAVFRAAIDRAREEGTHKADIDAAIAPKHLSKEKVAEITGRGQTKH